MTARWAHARSAIASLVIAASGLVLVWSALTKFIDLPAFQAALASHHVVPASAQPFIQLAVPIVEFLAGALGLASVAFASSRALASMLMAVFYVALLAYTLAVAWAPPPEPVSCGCGIRAGQVADWTPLVIQNAVATTVLAAAGLLLLRQSGPRQPVQPAINP